MTRKMAFVVAKVVLHVDNDERGGLRVNQFSERIPDSDAIDGAHHSSQIEGHATSEPRN